ncbi:MAG: ABC transporter permease [Anaerolineaceae bacterium]|nr:ABC transporter permease [Anaerolineaceae bacterium]
MAQMTTNTKDERLVRVGLLRRIFQVPEMGAVVGLIGVVIIFMLSPARENLFLKVPIPAIGRVLDNSADIGVMAVAISMLMIAGEFDLSIGFMTGSTGMIVGILSAVYGWPLAISMPLALIFALSVGFFNGIMRIRTGLPSFVITLGTMFVLRSANFAVTRSVTGNIRVPYIDRVPGYDLMNAIFSYRLSIGGAQFYITLIWWFAFTAFFTWFMLRTRWGSWIFASGGDPAAAKSVGVPVERVKVALFMFVHACAWISGMTVIFRLRSATASQGEFLQFTVLVAAVTGGNRMTGGYGSVIGASLGALIFGLTKTGIVAAFWDSDWFFAFLGVMLLLAIVLNLILRTQAEYIGTTAMGEEETDEEWLEKTPVLQGQDDGKGNPEND